MNELPAGTSWQVIAIGRANLPLTTIGLAMGGNARTGLEDTLIHPAAGAGHLQRSARRAAGGRGEVAEPEPATVDEVIERLKLDRDLIG